jgi:hypothetical protein
MQCVCGAAGAAAGWGRLQHPASSPSSFYKKKRKFIKVRPLCRYYFLKYTQTRHCCASCGQHFKADWQNFGAGKILPDLSF